MAADKKVSLRLDLPPEVIEVFENASRISKVDFNTVILVTLAVAVSSRSVSAPMDKKPQAKKAERKAKIK